MSGAPEKSLKRRRIDRATQMDLARHAIWKGPTPSYIGGETDHLRTASGAFDPTLAIIDSGIAFLMGLDRGFYQGNVKSKATADSFIRAFMPYYLNRFGDGGSIAVNRAHQVLGCGFSCLSDYESIPALDEGRLDRSVLFDGRRFYNSGDFGEDITSGEVKAYLLRVCIGLGFPPDRYGLALDYNGKFDTLRKGSTRRLS